MTPFTPAAFAPKKIANLGRPLALLLLSGLLACLFVSGCAKTSGHQPATQNSYVINNKRYYPLSSAEGYDEQGIASWYGPNFHGKRTSNGEIYDMHSMTAAHKTLPMDTILLIKNLENGRSTVVRINDRGPFIRGRIVDLSYQAAKTIGIDRKGIAKVQAIALGEKEISKLGAAPALARRNLSAGEFYVQIAAFAERKNALTLQKRFTAAGHTTVVQPDLSRDTILYNVQVYVGKTLQHAKRAEKALLDRGYANSFIIAR